MQQGFHPLVSVIVPAYNAQSSLAACLAGLAAQEYPRAAYEVIVVDDGSSDRTFEIAQSAGVCVIRQDNAGPASARNRGAAAANGDLLLFTDADCVPTPNWITTLTAPFEDPSIAGAKGAYLSRQTEVVARFTQLEYEDRYTRMTGAHTIDFIDTYSAAYRRNVFLANHGFDTIFPTASVEDQELSFRLAEKGYRLVFVPAAKVYHRHNPTVRAYVRRKYYIGYWKALIARWHPGRMVKDSHTPQALKLQILLVALIVLACAALAVTGLLPARPIRAPLSMLWISLSLFLLSTAPFLMRILKRDPRIFLPAAGLLFVRALSLGTGFIWGVVRFRRRADTKRPFVSASQRAIKRGMDLIGATLFLIIAILPMALIALLVRLDSPGPVIFTQERAGQNAKTFRILKFRTMVKDAEEQLSRWVNVEALAEPAFKIKDDPRVTRIGRILRRFSLDELPQLVNVIRGEMSLVGPRPEELRLVQRYTDSQRQRLAVKPGITGPMQINGRGDLSFEERLALETEYIQHFTLRRDMVILLRTLPAVLRGRGAY